MTSRSPNWFLAALLLCRLATAQTDQLRVFPGGSPSEPSGWVDTHVHLDGRYLWHQEWTLDYPSAAATALANMDRYGIAMSLVMPPPQTVGQTTGYDYTDLLGVVAQNPGRLALVAGGGTLNPLIQEALLAGQVSPELRSRFRATAAELIAAGAVAFGEMTALHLSLFDGHPYVEAPPDHPLFLLLAGLAASYQVPVDLHMEAVASDMATPARVLARSDENPPWLKENISGLERLLSHNRSATIIWVHAGWDNTGHFTVELMRRLLATHANLVFSVKVLESDQPALNRPLDATGEIEPDWWQMVSDYPGRFVIGSDQFYGIPDHTPQRPQHFPATADFLAQLPSTVRRQVGVENPCRLYRLETLAPTPRRPGQRMTNH